VADKPKIETARQMLNVVGPAGDKVVNRNDAESLRNQAIAQMGSKESCAPGNNGCFLRRFRLEHGREQIRSGVNSRAERKFRLALIIRPNPVFLTSHLVWSFFGA